jgi:hypothetical protein
MHEAGLAAPEEAGSEAEGGVVTCAVPSEVRVEG